MNRKIEAMYNDITPHIEEIEESVEKIEKISQEHNLEETAKKYMLGKLGVEEDMSELMMKLYQVKKNFEIVSKDTTNRQHNERCLALSFVSALESAGVR